MPQGVDWTDGPKQPKTVRMPVWLVERVTNTVAALQRKAGTGVPVNLSHLVSEAVYTEVLRLEREHNGGVPFPAALEPLRGGPGRGVMPSAMRRAWARRATDMAP